MKQALTYSGPLDFAALRYLLGAGVLFIALLLSGQSLRPPPIWPTALIGLFQTAGFMGFGQWALLSGGAGRVALLAFTMPFWAVLLAWLLLGDQLKPRHWVGLIFAAIGLLLIIEPWHAMGNTLSTVLAIAAGAAWGCGTVLTKRMLQRYKPGLLNLTAWQMLIGGLVLGVVALVVPQRTIVWSWPFIGALTYCVVLASSLAWWLWAIVLQRLSTAVASVSSLGVPVISMLLAWLILNERPSAIELFGVVMVLLGLVAISGVGSRRPY